jgi:lysyl-tRNA synthetase class 2
MLKPASSPALYTHTWAPLTSCLQLYIERAAMDESQPEGFAMLKNLVDSGDIVGVVGGIKRTEKGELSVMVRQAQVLTKSLLPLPDKWHGLADVEMRYRKR